MWSVSRDIVKLSNKSCKLKWTNCKHLDKGCQCKYVYLYIATLEWKGIQVSVGTLYLKILETYILRSVVVLYRVLDPPFAVDHFIQANLMALVGSKILLLQPFIVEAFITIMILNTSKGMS